MSTMVKRAPRRVCGYVIGAPLHRSSAATRPIRIFAFNRLNRHAQQERSGRKPQTEVPLMRRRCGSMRGNALSRDLQ